MRPIDFVRQAFQTHGLREIAVPEWSTDDYNFVVYYTPLTPAESEAVQARDPKTNADYNLALLIAKARDAHGQPLFQWGDLHALMHEANYRVILRIVNAMSEAMDQDEAKKNSPATISSSTDSV
jgi:hypothetical protein